MPPSDAAFNPGAGVQLVDMAAEVRVVCPDTLETGVAFSEDSGSHGCYEAVGELEMSFE